MPRVRSEAHQGSSWRGPLCKAHPLKFETCRCRFLRSPSPPPYPPVNENFDVILKLWEFYNFLKWLGSDLGSRSGPNTFFLPTHRPLKCPECPDALLLQSYLSSHMLQGSHQVFEPVAFSRWHPLRDLAVLKGSVAPPAWFHLYQRPTPYKSCLGSMKSLLFSSNPTCKSPPKH